MKRLAHKISAIVAALSITTFLFATLISELFLSPDTVVRVKALIVMPGLFLLIPAIAIAGITGRSMAGTSSARLLVQKKRRMAFIGGNGLLVLLPSAIVLSQWSAAGTFDSGFYVLQSVELVAGAINIALVSLNIRDGRRLSSKKRGTT